MAELKNLSDFMSNSPVLVLFESCDRFVGLMQQIVIGV